MIKLSITRAAAPIRRLAPRGYAIAVLIVGAVFLGSAAPSLAQSRLEGWRDDRRVLAERYATPGWSDTEALCSANQVARQRASSLGCYRGYGAPAYAAFERRSLYVPMRDGTRLAVDIYRPVANERAVEEPLPVVFTYSRYWRATQTPERTVETSVGILDSGQSISAIDDALARAQRGDREGVGLLLSHGYVFVRAEARGTGASFGVRNGDMSGIEAQDGADIIAWINAQPWSNGRVGMIGGSYEGMSQFLVASTNPEGLRAIFPAVATFDEYRASWSGAGVLRKYGLAWLAREARRDGVQAGVAGSTVNPTDNSQRLVAAIDGDANGALRDAARRERRSDPDAIDPTVYFTRQSPQALTLRDSLAAAIGSRAPIDIIETLYDPLRMQEVLERSPALRQQLLALRFYRDQADMLIAPQDVGPNNLAMLAPRINASGIAVYNWGGWRDFATLDTLLWHANLPGLPRKLTMGPWTHGPNEPDDRREDAARRLRPIEQLRWLDYWLKDIDNGIMDEPPVHYAISHGPQEFVWRSARDWPPHAGRAQAWFLGAGGALQRSAPVADAVAFDVDYLSSLGDHTRYHDAIGLGPLVLPDLDGHARQGALAFTSAPLARDITIVGSPIVSLSVRASTPQATLHAYLEEIDSEGRAALLSDGVMHSAHRTLGTPLYENLGLPFSDSRKDTVDTTAPLAPNTPALVRFDLQPISERIQAGHRIRLVITGAESQTNLVIPAAPPSRVWIDVGGRARSVLDLPIARNSRN